MAETHKIFLYHRVDYIEPSVLTFVETQILVMPTPMEPKNKAQYIAMLEALIDALKKDG